MDNTTEILNVECSIDILVVSNNTYPPDVNVDLLTDPTSTLSWNATRDVGYEYCSELIINEKNPVGEYSIDVTNLFQIWFNYYKTNGVAGTPFYGFKLTQKANEGETIVAYSSRVAAHAPYFTMTYRTNSPYVLDYAPAKYNNNGSIYNFQNRMNCYAYALQIYYNGNLDEEEKYFLRPGEFGISNISGINNYSQLTQMYGGFNNTNSSEYVDFIETCMYADAVALNFSIAPISVNNSFNLPDDFDSNSERVIALITGKSFWGNLDYHYYVRNGNGTCPNGHGGNCSMWTHKQSASKVSNKGLEYYEDTYLCDQNIHYTTHAGYSDILGPYFYRITKDACVYNAWHGYGRDSSSTGTPYCP